MEIEEIVDKVIRGEIEFHRLEQLVEPNLAVVIRRLVVEKRNGIQIPSIGSTIIDFKQVYGRNIENPIGAVQLPLGVAGPIAVRGHFANGDFLIPLATTEGALVASVNRGAKAVTKAGGAKVLILRDAMSRAPLFKLKSVEEVGEFLRWIQANLKGIRAAAESTTKHGKLVDVQPFVVGDNVWLRLSFETGDAMGMNMVTIASEEVCNYVERNFSKAECIAVSGNMCSDKKQSYVNNVLGRGKTVVAEALIPSSVLKEVLHTEAEAVNEVNLRKNLLGSARAGSAQYNAHFANVIAAMFIATGQDVAQVVESSSGITWTEVRGEDLYISVTLPSLEVGTVGGGTSLPTQREALSIMGVFGPGNPPGSNAKKFAEIVAAAVLAGELNLLAALANEELGRAHKRLGRNVKA